jgi:hypothetical protein
MLTRDNIEAIVADCTFNDWTFRVGESDGALFVQVLFRDKDRITGIEEWQHCRKWMISKHSTKSEVVRTAFKAVEAAVIHEAQEAFKYKGCRVYNPHFDIDLLVEFTQGKHLSLRPEPPTS